MIAIDVWQQSQVEASSSLSLITSPLSVISAKRIVIGLWSPSSFFSIVFLPSNQVIKNPFLLFAIILTKPCSALTPSVFNKKSSFIFSPDNFCKFKTTS